MKVQPHAKGRDLRVCGDLVEDPTGDPPFIRAWRADLLRSCAAVYLYGAGRQSSHRLERVDPVGWPLPVNACFAHFAEGRLVVFSGTHWQPWLMRPPVLAASTLVDMLDPCVSAEDWPFAVPWVRERRWLDHLEQRPAYSAKVLENTSRSAFGAHDSGALSRPNSVKVSMGGMGHTARLAARLISGFQHPAHPMPLENGGVVPVARSGA